MKDLTLIICGLALWASGFNLLSALILNKKFDAYNKNRFQNDMKAFGRPYYIDEELHGVTRDALMRSAMLNAMANIVHPEDNELCKMSMDFILKCNATIAELDEPVPQDNIESYPQEKIE